MMTNESTDRRGARYATFGEALIAERNRRGFSRRDVGRRAGATDKEVRSWEQGRALPSVHQLQRLRAAMQQLTPYLDAIRPLTKGEEMQHQEMQHSPINGNECLRFAKSEWERDATITINGPNGMLERIHRRFDRDESIDALPQGRSGVWTEQKQRRRPLGATIEERSRPLAATIEERTQAAEAAVVTPPKLPPPKPTQPKPGATPTALRGLAAANAHRQAEQGRKIDLARKLINGDPSIEAQEQLNAALHRACGGGLDSKLLARLLREAGRRAPVGRRPGSKNKTPSPGGPPRVPQTERRTQATRERIARAQEMVRERPDLTSMGLIEEVQKEFGVGIDMQSALRVLADYFGVPYGQLPKGALGRRRLLAERAAAATPPDLTLPAPLPPPAAPPPVSAPGPAPTISDVSDADIIAAIQLLAEAVPGIRTVTLHDDGTVDYTMREVRTRSGRVKL